MTETVYTITFTDGTRVATVSKSIARAAERRIGQDVVSVESEERLKEGSK